MSGQNITYHTVASGLRVVHLQSAGRVEYCGVTVNVGSRDEKRDRHGMAHFIEHTIFKGTSNHKSSYILNRMEEVGGELNAYTTKEETVVYTIAPSGNFRRAASLIADLVTNSVFPETEIDREREVVADEIDSYNDIPAEAIFDDFDSLFFKNSPLAHNILGTSSSIKNFTPEVCRSFLTTFYTAPNMIFFYRGALPANEVISIVESEFAMLPSAEPPLCRRAPRRNERFEIVRDNSLHQSHCLTAASVPGMKSPDRYAMVLLSNMLGGPGMNSILNIALREKRGLVYTVEAQTNFYTDCGMFSIYFGCDHEDIDRCRRLISTELDRISSTGISNARLEAAKRQYIGQCIVAAENREQEALSMGRSVLRYGKVRDFESLRRNISIVTRDDIMKMAQLIAPQHLSTLILR